MMDIPMSAALQSLPGYPMAGLPERRAALEAQGVDVIDLGAGDADLAPPPAAVDAIQRAVEDPAFSRYPFQRGLPAFREAVAAWMKTRFGVALDPVSRLLPLIGSKEGIAHLPQSILNTGDVGVIPDPGYQAYRGGLALAGAEIHEVALRPENDFLIPLRELPTEIQQRTRIVYLNYPNNPTAATAPDDYLQDAVDFCRERGAILVFDNAYSEIAFDGYRPRSILEFEGADEVAIEFHSLSKTYNMTGWRLGWAAGRSEIIARLSRVKTFVDTGVFKGVQAAGVAALESWAEWVPENVATFQSRRDAAVAGFRAAGFHPPVPKAGMYLWIPVPGNMGGSTAFAARALDHGVIVLPGAGLGAGGEGFFRVALTVPEARLRLAAERLAGLAAVG